MGWITVEWIQWIDRNTESYSLKMERNYIGKNWSSRVEYGPIDSIPVGLLKYALQKYATMTKRITQIFSSLKIVNREMITFN